MMIAEKNEIYETDSINTTIEIYFSYCHNSLGPNEFHQELL